MTPIAITFGINVLTSLLKNYIFPRWGKLGVQSIVFALALLGAGGYLYAQNVESAQVFFAYVFLMFTTAITFYEVLLSHLPFFKSEDGGTESDF